MMNQNNEDGSVSYYCNQENYERRPSSSSTASFTSSKRSSSHSVSSKRHSSFRLSNFFTLRRSSRFSLPTLLDDPLSPKQMEIEQLIEDDPERTVRFSITPEFAI